MAHPVVWRAKTRIAWLPDGEKISKISLFVLAQLTNVMDGRTDRQTPRDGMHIPRLCIASRGVKTVQSRNPEICVGESAGLWLEASSSAVAERPRDASCPSVVSFNSIIRRIESFIVSYVTYRFVTACS